MVTPLLDSHQVEWDSRGVHGRTFETVEIGAVSGAGRPIRSAPHHEHEVRGWLRALSCGADCSVVVDGPPKCTQIAFFTA